MKKQTKKQTYTSNILIYLTLTFTSGISLYTLYTTGITHYYQYQYHSALITTIMNELGHNQMLLNAVECLECSCFF